MCFLSISAPVIVTVVVVRVVAVLLVFRVRRL